MLNGLESKKEAHNSRYQNKQADDINFLWFLGETDQTESWMLERRWKEDESDHSEPPKGKLM